MEQPVLSNKDQFPTEEVIFSHLGKTKTALWGSVFDSVHSSFPELNEEWRYYNDGKSWLMKVTRKSKTIFWLSIWKNAFRTTFYFPDKAEEAILSSSISDELKEQFTGGKKYGKIRGVTITYKNKKDIEYAKALIGIKLSLK
ncbi:MAG: DUF3788 family protein [Ignavibacteriaceae bacterium]